MRFFKSFRDMHGLAVASVVAAAFMLQGCAAIGLAVLGTGTSVAAGAGVEHSLNGIAYKTFAVPANAMRFATLKTLARMDMPVLEDKKDAESERVWRIVAEAADRSIEIELEELTPQTTRMRVVANRGVFLTDGATATEIIVQTAVTLDSDAAGA